MKPVSLHDDVDCCYAQGVYRYLWLASCAVRREEGASQSLDQFAGRRCVCSMAAFSRKPEATYVTDIRTTSTGCGELAAVIGGCCGAGGYRGSRNVGPPPHSARSARLSTEAGELSTDPALA